MSSGVIYPRFLKAAHFPPSNYEEMMVDTLPSKKLELEFIHGASKKGCKGCYFHINDENKLIYPSAACAVKYDYINNQQSVFRRHDDDVVTIAKHPNEYIFATGQIGKDDMIYVWDSHFPENEPITKLDTHLHFKNGGVLACCFSNSGDLIATVGGNDTSSILLLYNWKKNELISSTKCLSSEIFDLQFSPDDSQIYVCGKKTLKLFSTKDLSSRSAIFGSKGTLQNIHSLCFNYKNQDAYVGVEDGSIYLFRDGKLIQSINGHSGNVFTLYPIYSNNSKYNDGFISGGKDGQVKYWKFNNTNIECYKSITINGFVKNVTYSKYDENVFATKANGDLYLIKSNEEIELLLTSHFGTTLKQLWGLDTFKELPLFVTCSDDGRVIVWNCETRKHVTILKLGQQLELRGIAISPSNEHLAITSKEGHLLVYQFNLETFTFSEEPIYSRKDSIEEISTLSFNHDGSLLALGSHDNFIYLYNCNNSEYKYIGKLTGHSSFITHLDISKCGNYLKSNSGDYEILLWDLNTRKQLSNCSNIEEIEWENITCPLGWTVRGIWKQDFDGTDINTCHVDFENNLIIAGEDTTMLSLYHYPCPIIKPFGYSYIGHCSHITNVKFIHYMNENNERITKLLSCGGADLTIFQWNLIENLDQLDQLNTSKALPSLKMDSMIGGGLYKPKSPRGTSQASLDRSPSRSLSSTVSSPRGTSVSSPRPTTPTSSTGNNTTPRSKSIISSNSSTPIKSPRSSSVVSNSGSSNSGFGTGGPKSASTSNTVVEQPNANLISVEPPTPKLVELTSFQPSTPSTPPSQSSTNPNDCKLKILLQYEKCKTILQIDLNNVKECTFEHLTSIAKEDFDIDENQKLDLQYHDNELDCEIHIRNDRHVQTCYDSFKLSSNQSIINVLLK